MRRHLIAIYISYCQLKISEDISFWEQFEVMLPNTDIYALIDFWWPTYSEKKTSKKEISIYEPTNPVRDVLKSRIMNFL